MQHQMRVRAQVVVHVLMDVDDRLGCGSVCAKPREARALRLVARKERRLRMFMACAYYAASQEGLSLLAQQACRAALCGAFVCFQCLVACLGHLLGL
jgi:hypothetical protein